MSNQELNSDVQNDPIENTSSTDVNAVDTPSNDQTSPVNDTNGHDDSSNRVSSDQSQTQIQPSPEEIRQKREEGKLRQEQQRAKELEEKTRKYEELFTKSPTVYKEALKAMRGLSDAEADRIVEDYKRQGVWSAPQQTVQNINPQTQQIDTQSIVEAAKQAIRKEQEDERTLKTFTSLIPEFAPENVRGLSEDERKEKLDTAMKVLYTAQTFSELTGKSFEETAIDAWSYLSGKSKEEIANARKQGELAGYAKALGNNAQANTAITKGVTQSEPSVTPEIAEQAKRLGLDPIKDRKYFVNSNEPTVVE